RPGWRRPRDSERFRDARLGPDHSDLLDASNRFPVDLRVWDSRLDSPRDRGSPRGRADPRPAPCGPARASLGSAASAGFPPVPRVRSRESDVQPFLHGLRPADRRSAPLIVVALPALVSGPIVDRIRIKTHLRIGSRFYAATLAAPARFRGGRASQGSALRKEAGPGGGTGLPGEGEEAGASPRGVPAGDRRRMATALHHAAASEPRDPPAGEQGHPRRVALDDLGA